LLYGFNNVVAVDHHAFYKRFGADENSCVQANLLLTRLEVLQTLYTTLGKSLLNRSLTII